MKFIKLNCNNCNAQLDIDMENMQAFCPYCGQKLILDFEQQAAFVFAEKEKTKRTQERTKCTQMEYNYKERQEKRDNVMNVMLILLPLGMALILSLLGLLEQKREESIHKAKNEIKVGISSKDLKGSDYDDVEILLKNAGFDNIKIVKDKDLVFGWISKDGEVEEVSINGDSDFSENDWFPNDATVKITYHTY